MNFRSFCTNLPTSQNWRFLHSLCWFAKRNHSLKYFFITLNTKTEWNFSTFIPLKLAKEVTVLMPTNITDMPTDAWHHDTYSSHCSGQTLPVGEKGKQQVSNLVFHTQSAITVISGRWKTRSVISWKTFSIQHKFLIFVSCSFNHAIRFEANNQ